MKITAIVLAAGESSRMGTNKLLLKLGDKNILEHLLERLVEYETIIVTGHKPEEIRPIIQLYECKEVYNRDFEKGMTTSFKAGLLRVEEDIDAVLMVLSDTFGFKKELIKKMITTLEKEESALIVSPVYKGKHGHPVLVKRHLFKEFLNLSTEETLKEVIQRHDDKHRYVEGSMWCTIDMDTPQDYLRVKELWKTIHV
jgi:molybdenum cofactor cytidylyltransferase